jgi:alanine racemase
MAAAKLHIDLDALVANWRTFKRRVAPAHAAAVVKADAYGLGARQVATALQNAGCARFYVAWAQEGENLRACLGSTAEIMVFHGVSADTLGLCVEHNLQPVLNDLAQLDRWQSSAAGRPAALHIDTGMNRLGMAESDWQEAARRFPAPTRLLSHLACGDEDSPVNAAQLEHFTRARKLWPGVPCSLSATGGSYLDGAYHFDEVRPGIGLYGGGPAPATGEALRTVVTLTASVLQVRTVQAGETVGYGCTWTANGPTQLATIGIGYADGYLRSASNRGHVVVQGQKRPVVGRVSMDLIVVDITGLSVASGDDIEVIGPNMPLSEAAGAMGTIDYEILTRLGARLERRYSGCK